MRHGLVLIGALAISCGSTTEVVYVDPPPYQPVECSFELDTEFGALELPTDDRGTHYTEAAASPRGVVYVAAQERVWMRTVMARFDGRWTVEPIAGEWWQLGAIAASDEEAWLTGELRDKPALARRANGAWSLVEVQPTERLYSPIAVGRDFFALSYTTTAPARIDLLRLDAAGWRTLSLPPEWMGVQPTALAKVGGEIVVGASQGLPGDLRTSQGLLGRVVGDRVVALPVAVDIRAPQAIAGTSLADLLLLSDNRVYWVDAVHARAKHVHEDAVGYADVWSPRPGAALLSPSYYHSGRLTMLDGEKGATDLELERPGTFHHISKLSGADDGKTVHFLAHEHGYRARHYRGTCR